MASCLSVLRFVSSKENEESLELLISRIDDHFADAEGTVTETKNHDDTTSRRNGKTITISNRYFSADVLLERVPGETNDQSAPCNDGGNVAAKEDGIVLVVDASKASDLAATMAGHHDRAVAAGGGDLLRLCVSLGETDTSHLTPKQIEEDYSRRIIWCLDRGYEYVACCDLSDDGVLHGHDERDKEGFARIVEAIRGTVWSSAVMEKQKISQLQASYVEAREVNQQDSACVGSDMDGTCDDTANSYEPPDSSQLPPLTLNLGPSKEEDKEREEKARKTLLGQVEATNQHDGDMREQPRELDRNEHLMDQFEDALRQASRIRNLSHAGELRDDERRQRAGDAAMLLMEVLGKMGYDEDSGSDEETQHGSHAEEDEKT